MKVLDFIKKIRPGRPRDSSRVTNQDVLVWGIFFGGIFLLLLILWDGYIFNETLNREFAPQVMTPKTRQLSKEDLDEVIKIMDEREKEFQQILLQ